MAFSECLPTRLTPPAERTCFSQARTTDWTNAIERLGVPLFCWGQNSAQGYLQTSLPPTGGGVTTFPRAPGMAATWNMSAVKAQGAAFATEARSLFNQGGFRGTTFSCPGSIVLILLNASRARIGTREYY